MPGERADSKQSASEPADFEWPPRDLDKIFVRVDAIGDIASVDAAGWRRDDSTHRPEPADRIEPADRKEVGKEIADRKESADRPETVARRMVEDRAPEVSLAWPEMSDAWPEISQTSPRPRDWRSVPRRSHGRHMLLVAATLIAAVAIVLPWFLVWRSGASSAVSPQPAASTEVASVVPPILSSLPTIGLPFEFRPTPPRPLEAQSAAPAIATSPEIPDETPAPTVSDEPTPPAAATAAAAPEVPRRNDVQSSPSASASIPPRSATTASALPSPPASQRSTESPSRPATAPPPTTAAPPPAAAAPASVAAATAPAVTPPAPPVATPPPPMPAPAPSTASPEGSPSPPAAVPTDESLVTTTLRRYALAFEQLDVAAVSTVWPRADGRALKRAFDAIEYQQVTMDRCNVRVSGATAVADCDGWISYVPKVGKKDPRTLARRWDFELQKDGGAWKISTAAVR